MSWGSRRTAAAGEMYRVVIEVFDPFGNLDPSKTSYLGPYDSKSAAKGRRTVEVRQYKQYYLARTAPGGTVKGRVQVVKNPEWEDVDE